MPSLHVQFEEIAAECAASSTAAQVVGGDFNTLCHSWARLYIPLEAVSVMLQAERHYERREWLFRDCM